jgi:DNA-directed RNA polymerase subunit RPC12/RpoP
MNEQLMPSVCPFCKKDHEIDLLKIQIKAEVRCPYCNKVYFIPYSEVKSMIEFQHNLENVIIDKDKPDT